MMAKIRYTGLAPAETGHFSHHGKVGEASSTGMIVSVVTLEYGGESIYEVLGATKTVPTCSQQTLDIARRT